MSVDSDIALAIITAVEDSALDPVAYPNVAFTGSVPYYRLSILGGKTIPLTVVATNDYAGIVQIDIVCASGIGLPKANILMNTALAVFPRGKRLTENGVTVLFDEAGWPAPPVQSGSEYFIPLSFPYRSLSKE